MEIVATKKNRRSPEEHFHLSRSRPFHFYSGAISTAKDREQLATPVRWSLHYELEIALCLDGCVRFLFGEDSRQYTAGDAWFVGSWEPHNREILSDSYEVTGLVFRPEVLTNDLSPEALEIDWVWPFQSNLAARPVVPEDKRSSVIDLGRRMQAYGGVDNPLRQVRMKGLLFELLALVLEPDILRQAENGVRVHESERLRPALALVNQRQDRVTVDEAAEACALSRSSFTTLFRRRMGVSFSQFALRRRLGSAAEAIDQGSLPLKAIAQQWGFANESHLNRVFRKYMGCTPTEYRSKRKQV